jgi:regulator of nonsense transcripts 1
MNKNRLTSPGLGNHLISDSKSSINATGDDDSSILDGDFGRLGPSRRRRQDDEETETDVFDDDDLESMASLAVDGAKPGMKPEEEAQLPAHACS